MIGGEMNTMRKTKRRISTILVICVCLLAIAAILFFYRTNHISESQVEKAILSWSKEEWGEAAGTVGYSEITQYRYENQQFSRILSDGTVLRPYLIFLNGEPRAVVSVETHTPENVRAYAMDEWSSLPELLVSERFTVIRCEPGEPKEKGQAKPYALFEDGSVIGLTQYASAANPNTQEMREALEQAASVSSVEFVFTEIKPQKLLN